jgi:hypothetical protein
MGHFYEGHIREADTLHGAAGKRKKRAGGYGYGRNACLFNFGLVNYQP